MFKIYCLPGLASIYIIVIKMLICTVSFLLSISTHCYGLLTNMSYRKPKSPSCTMYSQSRSWSCSRSCSCWKLRLTRVPPGLEKESERLLVASCLCFPVSPLARPPFSWPFLSLTRVTVMWASEGISVPQCLPCSRRSGLCQFASSPLNRTLCITGS